MRSAVRMDVVPRRSGDPPCRTMVKFLAVTCPFPSRGRCFSGHDGGVHGDDLRDRADGAHRAVHVRLVPLQRFVACRLPVGRLWNATAGGVLRSRSPPLVAQLPPAPGTACPGQAMRLTTDAELAEQMGISLERFHQLRKRRRWPCVRLGRFEVRFTDAQIEQIIAMHTESRARPRRVDDRPSVDGQTQRSATRGRRHLSDASGS